MAVGKALLAYYLYRRHKAKKLVKQSNKINRARQNSKLVKNKKPAVKRTTRRKKK